MNIQLKPEILYLFYFMEKVKAWYLKAIPILLEAMNNMFMRALETIIRHHTAVKNIGN